MDYLAKSVFRIIKDFILFEGGIVKSSRFQQFFSINKIINRIKPYETENV